MSLLTRYLLRSFLPLFAAAAGVMLFVLLMNYFLRLFNLAVMKGVPLSWILFCFARLLPYFLSLALPMAFIVALLLTLGHLSETGEVLAMRGSGFSFREILAPYLACALLLTALLLYVNHKASPEGFHSFKNSYARVVSQVARMDIEARAMVRLGDWQFFAEEVGLGGGLKGVRLVKTGGDYKQLRVGAPEGRARLEAGRGVSLELRRGTLQWPNEDPQSNTRSTFGRMRLFIPFVDYRKVARDPDLQELDTPRLRERLREAELPPSRRREYATEAALRSAGALAPLVLFWIACPLGLRLDRRGPGLSFALSLAVIFLFYGLLALGIGLGRKSLALSPWGPWLPDAVCLAVGAGLWRRRLAA